MPITSVSKAQPMRECEINAVDALNNVIDKINNINKTLWEGSFSSGNITIPNLSDYYLFGVFLANELSVCFVYSPPGASTFTGGSLDVTSAPNMYSLACRAGRNGNTLSYEYSGSMAVKGTSVTKKNIVKIVGIL